MIFSAAYQKPQAGFDVGRIVVRVLREMDWKLEAAAITCQQNNADFSRALHGLAPLDAHRLALLPAKFWWKFSRRLLTAVLRREEHEHETKARIA